MKMEEHFMENIDYTVFAKYFDHTLLKPTATEKEIIELCREANDYRFASVCVNLSNVELARTKLDSEIKVCTVIDFPFGVSTGKQKYLQVKEAHNLRVSEVDVVIDIAKLLQGKVNHCVSDLRELTSFAHENNMLVKIIVETCYLDEAHIEMACQVVEESAADYIKTSTGYGTRGASFEDIVLFKKYLHKDTKIKASGGIKTLDEVQKYISLGCERIGTSRAVSIMNEALSKNLIAK